MRTILLFICSGFISITLSAQTVSHFAGSGGSGYLDGIGTIASFAAPLEMDFDASGNMYLADHDNFRIRKITPATAVTTFAGSGSPATINGTGTTASFDGPSGIAVDAAGNIYVSEVNGNVIRKITTAGVVSTLAGDGSIGNTDGPGLAAKFNSPYGLAIDAAGNIYVADYYNHAIRKIDTAANVTTLAGNLGPGDVDGPVASARFENPVALSIDAVGNIYVADVGNHKIRKITPTGMVTTLAGNGIAGNVNGIGSAAQFYSPAGIAVDNKGNVYVTDYGTSLVRKITSTGVVTTVAGLVGTRGNTNGSNTMATFNYPSGIDIDPSTGALYVSEHGNKNIRKIIIAAPTSLNHLSQLAGDLVLFPNPAKNDISIQANFKKRIELTMTVLNLQGCVMQEKGHNVTQGNNVIKLSFHNLASGTYVIQFQEDGVITHTAKVVKN